MINQEKVFKEIKDRLKNTFKPIKSKTEAYKRETVTDIIADIKKYKFAIVYKLDEVKILGKEEIESLENIKDLEDLLEIRAFNKKGELHAVYLENEYIGRIIEDAEDAKVGEDAEVFEDTEVVEEHHLIWGTPDNKKIISKEKKTFLSEDRGISLEVPIEVKTNPRAFITVRNYLSKSNDSFEFTDYRMVNFFAGEVKDDDKQ